MAGVKLMPWETEEGKARRKRKFAEYQAKQDQEWLAKKARGEPVERRPIATPTYGVDTHIGPAQIEPQVSLDIGPAQIERKFDPTYHQDVQDMERGWLEFRTQLMEEAKRDRQGVLPVNRTNPRVRVGMESPLAGKYPEASAASAPDRVTKDDIKRLEEVLNTHATQAPPRDLSPKAQAEIKRLQDELYQIGVDSQHKAMSHKEALDRLQSEYFTFENMLLGDPDFGGEDNRGGGQSWGIDEDPASGEKQFWEMI